MIRGGELILRLFYFTTEDTEFTEFLIFLQRICVILNKE